MMNTLAPISFGCGRNAAVKTTVLMQPRSCPKFIGDAGETGGQRAMGHSRGIRTIAAQVRQAGSQSGEKPAASSETSFALER